MYIIFIFLLFQQNMNVLQNQVHRRDPKVLIQQQTATNLLPRRNQKEPEVLVLYHPPAGTSSTGLTSATLHSRVWVTMKAIAVTKASAMTAANPQNCPPVLPRLTLYARSPRKRPTWPWSSPPLRTQCSHSCTLPMDSFLRHLRCLSHSVTCSEALHFLHSCPFSAHQVT